MWSVGAPRTLLPPTAPVSSGRAARRPTSISFCLRSVSSPLPPALKKRRKKCLLPGEAQGIAEEMRFVAMRLRKVEEEQEQPEEKATWQPTMEGFLKYLVDSRLVFNIIESVVEQSEDVYYAQFRKTGLERTQNLSKDIEHFRHLGYTIPDPTDAGIKYAGYLEKIAATSAPSFLSHFYNIYFAHVFGGKVIGDEVSKRLPDVTNLEFYNWKGDVQVLLRNVREKLNEVGQDWARSEKSRCLRETSKCFQFSGTIIRLIVE